MIVLHSEGMLPRFHAIPCLNSDEAWLAVVSLGIIIIEWEKHDRLSFD